MKTKNILLLLFAFALLSTPLLAQDFHENEYKQNMGKIGASVAQIHKDSVEELNKEIYLDITALRNQLFENISIDLQKLSTKATNSIKDNKISAKEQYDLLIACVKYDNIEVLKILLEAGFNPSIHEELNKNLNEGEKGNPSLYEIATQEKNNNALNLLLKYKPNQKIK